MKISEKQVCQLINIAHAYVGILNQLKIKNISLSHGDQWKESISDLLIDISCQQSTELKDI